jgi:hypothetical protein
VGIMSGQGDWQAMASEDLASGLSAARQLQALPVPPSLSKQLANYVFRADAELASREIDPAKLPDGGGMP